MSLIEATAATDTAAPEPSIEEIAAQVFGEGTPSEAPAEPEKAAAPAKVIDPAAERVSARIIAAKRADLRAAQARADIAAQRAELEKGRAELADLAKVAEQVKAAKLSPTKALELLGLTPKEFLQTLASENEPELVAQRVVASTQSETEKLRAELAEMKAAQAARDAEARSREITAASYQAQEQFLAHVASGEYPYLHEEFTPQEIAERGWQVATEHAEAYKSRFGEYPDDSVIAEHLEAEAKARAGKRAEWRTRVGQKALPPSQGTTTGDQRATQPVTGPSPRTLTSRAASEKATTPPKWSQEQADEESLRILMSSFKTG